MALVVCFERDEELPTCVIVDSPRDVAPGVVWRVWRWYPCYLTSDPSWVVRAEFWPAPPLDVQHGRHASICRGPDLAGTAFPEPRWGTEARGLAWRKRALGPAVRSRTPASVVRLVGRAKSKADKLNAG
jgi:hypothetical protein